MPDSRSVPHSLGSHTARLVERLRGPDRLINATTFGTESYEVARGAGLDDSDALYVGYDSTTPFPSPDGSYEFLGLLTRVDPDGTFAWTVEQPGAVADGARHMATSPSGHSVVAFNHNGPSLDLGGGELAMAGFTVTALAEYDREGNLVWSSVVGCSATWPTSIWMRTAESA